MRCLRRATGLDTCAACPTNRACPWRESRRVHMAQARADECGTWLGPVALGLGLGLGLALAAGAWLGLGLAQAWAGGQ